MSFSIFNKTLFHMACVSIGWLSASNATAAPTKSAFASVTETGSGATQSTTSSGSPAAALVNAVQERSGAAAGSTSQLRAGGIAQNNYLTRTQVEIENLGTASASSGWRETFTNTTPLTFDYKFTYRLSGGSFFAGLIANDFGTIESEFLSKFSVTKTSGVTTDDIRSRKVSYSRAPGPDYSATVTSIGELTGEEKQSTAIVDNLFSELMFWQDTYITIEIGEIAPSESFTLGYMFQTSINNFCLNCLGFVRSGMNDLFNASSFDRYTADDPRVGLSRSLSIKSRVFLTLNESLGIPKWRKV
jgi:hypothetical protein